MASREWSRLGVPHLEVGAKMGLTGVPALYMCPGLSSAWSHVARSLGEVSCPLRCLLDCPPLTPPVTWVQTLVKECALLEILVYTARLFTANPCWFL